MSAAVIAAAAVTGLVVLVTLAAFVWAAREDGRDQRRRSVRRRLR
jgi:hypothetical protein